MMKAAVSSNHHHHPCDLGHVTGPGVRGIETSIAMTFDARPLFGLETSIGCDVSTLTSISTCASPLQ